MSKTLLGKIFVFLLVVGLLFAVAPTRQAEAAIGIPTWVSQTPETPTSTDSVVVLIYQPVLNGEYVGLEYKIGETNTKIAASYVDSTSHPEWNWRAIIPAQADGTTVSYQLYMYGSDLNLGVKNTWSGFNWSYTVTDAPLETLCTTICYVSPNGDDSAMGNETSPFLTIQKAIDSVSVGGTVQVAVGTYNENISINTANITLQSTGTAEETIINANGGFGVSLLKDLGTVTVDGFTVQGWLTSGIIQETANRPGTTSRVLNNIVIGEAGEVDHGNCIQVSGDSSLVEGNTVSGGYNDGTGSYGAIGIYVYLANNAIIRNNVVTNSDIGIAVTGGSLWGQTPVTDVLITGNEVSGSEVSISISLDANNTSIQNNYVHDNLTGLSEEYNSGYGPSGTVALHNRIVDNDEQALVEATDTTPIPEAHIFMAEQNWWGNSTGPGKTKINEYVDFTPWCTDAACTTFAPDKNGVVELSGTINIPGGIFIGTPGLTYHLAADTVIQNNSPCFVIEAGNTTINAEEGAKCVPTDGSNGIDVSAGLNGIRIVGLEIDGTDQTTGSGVVFAGAITDFQLVDNYIHDLDGSGVVFTGSPSGFSRDIQGNLFQDLGAAAVVVPSALDPDLNAHYNAWGSLTAPVITDVDTSENTHAAIELRSTNPDVDNWKNQVFMDDEITYEVYGVLKNITGATFTLEYDATALELVSVTPVTSVFEPIEGETSVVDYSVNGMIQYDGLAVSAVSSVDATGTLLFTVTFEALKAGDSHLTIDPETDVFAMFPMVEHYTNNVYSAYLDDVTVQAIARPSLTVVGLDEDFVAGASYMIENTITNPADGGVWIESPTEPDAIGWIRISDVLVADITQIEFLSNDVWHDFRVQDTDGGHAVQQDGDDVIARFGNYNFGFDIQLDGSDFEKFRFTFKNPGTHTVTVEIYDMMDTVVDGIDSNDILLASYTEEITIFAKPIITYTYEDYYIVDEAGEFKINIDNTGGKFYDNTVAFDIVIEDHVVADFSAMSCTLDATTWDILAMIEDDTVNGNVIGRITGKDGLLTIPANSTSSLNCSVTYATAGAYTTNSYMVDVLTTGESTVSNQFTATSTVYTAPVITADFPTGPYVAGDPVTVPVSITNPLSIPGPFELVLNLPAGTPFTFGGVDYLCGDDPDTTEVEVGCPAIPVTLPLTAANLVFTVTVDWSGNIMMSLYDTSWDPDRLLATFTEEGVTVLGTFDLSGIVSMQGHTMRGGVPVTLSGTLGFGPYTVNSIDQLGLNLTFTNLEADAYTITTNQPRYLNITADLLKTIDLNSNHVMPVLYLRGGNAVWINASDGTPNTVIDVNDASKVTANWGATTDIDADVNFDQIVNIQDLALVGGNMDLTSAIAYGSWVPVTPATP